MNLLDYQNMPIGETRRGECPRCGKNKFYITRKTGGIAFICFRASCSYAGYDGSSSYISRSAATSVPKHPERTGWTGYIGFITLDDVVYFQERFGLEIDSPQDAAYWIKLAHDGRYALPIWGERDQFKGQVLRRPQWAGYPLPPRADSCHEGMPKSITYLEPDAPSRLAWAHSADESTVVIVEDQISAMRIASLGITAVALLGTNMGTDEVAELLRFKNARRFILALDPDAFGKAIKLHRMYGGVLRDCHIASLQYDAKDYPTCGEGSKMLLEDLRYE